MVPCNGEMCYCLIQTIFDTFKNKKPCSCRAQIFISLPVVFHFPVEEVLIEVVFALAFVVVYVAHPVFAEDSFAAAFAAVDGFAALPVADLPLAVDFAVFPGAVLPLQVSP